MVNWNDTTEREMLLAVAHVNPPTRAMLNKAAELLGGDYTAEGIRQRYAKIKKAAAAQWGDVDTTGGEGEGKTPVKRGAKKAAGEKKSASGKRKAKKDAEEDGNEDQQDDQESPSKKVKTEKTGGESEDEV